MKRDAIISIFIAIPVSNLSFWEYRGMADKLMITFILWMLTWCALTWSSCLQEKWEARRKRE